MDLRKFLELRERISKFVLWLRIGMFGDLLALELLNLLRGYHLFDIFPLDLAAEIGCVTRHFVKWTFDLT